MNNPNPFVPQGSLLEQDKRRSRMKLAVFCVLAFGVCGLTAMLIQGCKRENTEAENNPPVDTNAMAVDTNLPPMNASNTMAVIPTNLPVIVPPPVESTTTEYTVVAGDTLGKIAKAHGISLKALEAANPNVQPTRMKIGDKIMIPASTAPVATSAMDTTASTGASGEIYKVKSGDTLTKIARQFGVSVKAIESENNLSTTKIKVGQKLKIPAKAEAAAPAPAPVAPVIAPAPGALPSR